MTYSYLSEAAAAAVVESKYPEARRLPALSDLLDGDMLWDQAELTLVYQIYTWIEGTGLGRRIHTCAARKITGDKDLAFGFSKAVKTADPALVAAAADEILDMIAAGVTAADQAAAGAAIKAVLYSGLAESPSRHPMFAALRAQREARLVAD